MSISPHHHHDLKFVEAIEREEFLGNRIICDDKVYTGFIDTTTICHLLKMIIDKNIISKVIFEASVDNYYLFFYSFFWKNSNDTLKFKISYFNFHMRPYVFFKTST